MSLYALSDSQLLFWKRADGSLFLREIIAGLRASRPSVAYIGASNGDNLEIFESICKPAMEQADAGECRMILRRPDREAGKFLEYADVVVLAGGDVNAGWRAFEENGLKELIPRRYLEGALLIGISAGAVQLGLGLVAENGSGLLRTFGFLPFYVGAHEEREDWPLLRKLVSMAKEPARGIGIPFGAGIHYNSGEVEVLRRSAIEFVTEAGGVRESILLPVD